MCERGLYCASAKCNIDSSSRRDQGFTRYPAANCARSAPPERCLRAVPSIPPMSLCLPSTRCRARVSDMRRAAPAIHTRAYGAIKPSARGESLAPPLYIHRTVLHYPRQCKPTRARGRSTDILMSPVPLRTNQEPISRASFFFLPLDASISRV